MRPVRAFRFLIDGQPHPADAFAMPRFDLPCRLSGYWGVVPVSARAGAQSIVLGAEVTHQDGSRHETELGRIAVAERSAVTPQPSDQIAICLGTHNPDPGLLARQLESIRNQTDTGWTCVISDDHSDPPQFDALLRAIGDDPRFSVSRTEKRIGFYRNFERAIGQAPAHAGLIALCDQDDVWYPDKLAVLRAGLGPAMLVYCDQRLVDERGNRLRDTLWVGRANNWANLASLLIANTVTGSGALFRRSVAELALPFPDSPGLEFHDHWIALCALAAGELRYLDRPLYDYVQHSGSVLGQADGPAGHRRPGERGRAAYFLGFAAGRVRAQTLLGRCGPAMPAAKRRALERYVAAERSWLGLLWLLVRPLRALGGRTETLASEWELVGGLVWRRAASILARPWVPERLMLDTRFPDPPRFEQPRLARWRRRMQPPPG